MKNKIGGIIGLILTAVILALYLPPLVLYGIINIGNIIGFVLAGLSLIFALTQFKMASDRAPKRDFDRSVSGGTRGRLHRQFNHDMGRDTVLIERGGLGNFTADTSIGYDGDRTSHAYLITWLVILALAVAFFAQGFIRMFSVNTEAASDDSSDIIVLGCGVRGENPTIMLRQRIEAARLYLALNPDTYAVVSGGQGAGEDISEAECMREYLTDSSKASEDESYFYQACDMHGVDRSQFSDIPVIDPGRVLVENTSVNTIQNISNSINVLTENGRSATGLVIVTQWYHEYRAIKNAESAGAAAGAYPAAIDYWAAATYTTQECASILYHTFI
ncbi:MAG: YdcF family protein [Candidatus Weimeria sp.]